MRLAFLSVYHNAIFSYLDTKRVPSNHFNSRI